MRSCACRWPPLLGAALALRPRRKGTPPRMPAVVQTQIILAVVGALMMLVVGSSLARAFGIVGAANLIRYRAKIDDPKDAGVMLGRLPSGWPPASGCSARRLLDGVSALLLGSSSRSSKGAKTVRFLTIKAGDRDATNCAAGRADPAPLQSSIRAARSADAELCYEVDSAARPRDATRSPTPSCGSIREGQASVDWSEKKEQGK